MGITGVQLDRLGIFGKDRVVVGCKVTIGSSGAVSSVSGGPFAATAVDPYRGSVTKESTAGQYTFVMPGFGGVNDIQLLSCFVEHTADVLNARVNSKSLSARSITLQLTDPGLAGGEESPIVEEFSKVADDSNAGDATAETVLGYAPAALTLTSIKYVPAAALTADNSNYATITVSKYTSAGASKTTVASVTTQISGGGSWTAFAPLTVPISVASVASGGSLTFEISKTGTGVVVPRGRLIVTGTIASADSASLAANATSGAILHVAFLVKNSDLTP